MNRREFLAVSAASLIATSAGKLNAEPVDKAAPWYRTMLRCGQINFNERDPLTMKPEEWMDYWASLRIDAVLLNGGGIMAFYPTQVPYHHRSEFLGSRDLFGEMTKAARAKKMRVVARMDCNYAYEEAFKAHPEWFQHNADGTPRRHNECPWLYKTCMFSTYFTEQMPAIYREINQNYMPDGFYTNGWPGTEALEVCHCENCQKIYREQTGGTPPETTDVHNPVYRRYYDIYMDRIAAVWQLWQKTAQEHNADSVYVGNLGGGMRTVKDVKRLGEVAAWFNADNQGRTGNTPVWMCAQQGHVARSVMNGRTVTNVVGSYSNSSIDWRHTSKPPAEMTIWAAQAAASGMVPWLHRLGGQVQDNRWREPGHAFFDWLATNQAHFRNHTSLAEIAVLYPQKTIAFYGSNGTATRKLNGETIDSAEYLEGMYAALLEGRFLFDFVHEDNLSAATLKKYKALLIPNAAFMSDAQCAAIREYANGGGSIFATFETSRYDEWGNPRPDFALKDLFGAGVSGERIGPLDNSYMSIDREHPILASFKDTTILPGAEFRVPLSPVPVEQRHLSVIPHYPAFPPEMVFPRTPHTDDAAAIFREQGNSRIVYFPGDIDRSFWKSGSPDLSRLIIDSIHWLLRDQPQTITVEGDGLIQLFGWQTEPGFALHLLNYTNPNATRPFFSKTYPIGPVQIAFQAPAGRHITTARALRAGRELPLHSSGSLLKLDLPKVADYEVIAFS